MSLERSLELRKIYTDAVGHTTVDGNILKKVTVSTPTVAANDFDLTAAHIIGGMLRVDPAGANATFTLPTPTELKAAVGTAWKVGSSMELIVQNTGSVGELLTFVANSNTLTPASIVVDGGEQAKLLILCTAVATPAYTYYLLSEGGGVGSGAVDDNITVTTISGTQADYTGAEVVGGLILHDPTGDENVNMPTGTLIDAAFPGVDVGSSFITTITNTADGGDENITLTINAIAGLTSSIATVEIGSNETLRVLFRKTGANAFTVYSLGLNGTVKKVKSGVTVLLAPAAKSTIGCHAQVNLADGDLFATIVAQPDYPRTILVKITDANDSLTAGTVTIVGLDQNGVAQTAVYSIGAIGGTASLVLDDAGKNIAWSKITDMDVASTAGVDAGTDKIEIGYQDTFGLPTSTDGQLISVYKSVETDIDTVTGTVVVGDGTVLLTDAADGTSNYVFYYTYV